MLTELTNEELADWLRGRDFPSARQVYHVVDSNAVYTLFGPTDSTGRVLLPTPLIREWIQALLDGRISTAHDPRSMRDRVQPGSPWAKQLHSFETHLWAVVQKWSRTQS